MKKNFKSVKSFAMAALTLALSVSAFTSCQDDSLNGDDSTAQAGELELKDGLKVYPLTYNTYMTDHDVEITTPDTTKMSISATLLKNQDIELKEGNVISVWRNKSELPFMRQITGVSTTGNTVNVTTKDIQASDVIENADLEFDSKIYVDQSVSATNSNGTINSEHFVDKKDGVYHPVAIFMHSAEEDNEMVETCEKDVESTKSNANYSKAEPYATNSSSIKGNQNYTGEKKVYVVSELENSNFDFGVDLKGKVKDVCFPITNDDKDTVAFFGIEEASAAVAAGIHASMDISWFQLKRFEVGPYYSMDVDIKPTLNASAKIINWSEKYPIAKFQGYTSVFWVGPVPVSISFKPALTMELEVKGSVSGSIGLEYEAKGSGHSYAVYDDGHWSVEKGGEPFTQSVTPVFGGSIEASAKAGIYLNGDVMLYGVAGPTLSVGPYLEAKAKASLDLVEKEAAAEASLTFGIDATLGAKLEVWKWNLAKWSVTENLYKKEIWKASWSTKDWLENSKKVAEETGNMTEGMQKIIQHQEEDEYVEEAINQTTASKSFISYMTTAPGQKASALNNVKEKYRADWVAIEKNPTTFYDWNTEFQLWYGKKCNDGGKLYNIAMSRILEDNLSKCEFLNSSNLKEGVLKNIMANYIYSGDSHQAAMIKADQNEAVMKDWKNIRAEYLRLKTGSTTAIDVDSKFVNPWFAKFYGNK